MTTPDPYSGPDRRLGQTERALLATQIQKIDGLTTSVKALADAVASRPTREELRRKRRLAWLGSILATFFVALTLSGLWMQQGKIKQACEDRNANTAAFQVLLRDIVAAGQGNDLTEERSQFLDNAFRNYLVTLKPVEC